MNDGKLFEPRTVGAIIIAFLGIFGWQYFISKKYPAPIRNTVNVESKADPASKPDSSLKSDANPQVVSSKGESKQGSIGGGSGGAEVKSNTAVIEKFFELRNEKFNLKISSLGMGFKGLELNEFRDRDAKKVLLGDENGLGLFALRLTGQESALPFEVEKVSDNEFRGVHKSTQLEVVRTLKFNKETFSVSSDILIKAGSEQALKGLEIVLSDKVVHSTSTHFLFPSYDHQDFVVKHAGKVETVNYSMAKENIAKDFPSASLVSMGSQYFTTAILDRSDLIPEIFLSSIVKDSKSSGGFKYLLNQSKDDSTLKQVFYFGPKRVETLRAVDSELVETLNYGMFGIIAHPMLWLMKFLFNLTGNWGIAIILLTLVVRFIVMPANFFSFKSMKAMQKIQPLLKSAKEKYKDDPVAANRETMAIMKQNGANPLSGCLPMLLQIPVFFALYRVIASSIEIYQQPFLGWITDLSLHDRFFVLPILMGATMAIQQKITPTASMDPAQAKILMFMPILFTGLMIYLPSGLTLYMFVSALFGIIQQYFFMKHKTA